MPNPADRLSRLLLTGLTGPAGLSWWWAARRGHRAGCAGGDCACRPGDKIVTVRSNA
ncbi:hypothetical protein [Micromonospora robiginosa]|uniref:Uncharacterized protein n=1 Tax=Micromonospora robiginosa TaxID=2749844 RepID=A0A7L6B0V0_9ACTN|nr:hypothetical protein [Micromonospora ferruginea]QLQ35598.1 hypothetical protein H1D33_19730 [Micromonospora ferruginea]